MQNPNQSSNSNNNLPLGGSTNYKSDSSGVPAPCGNNDSGNNNPNTPTNQNTSQPISTNNLLSNILILFKV
jgi:hypothetical protein